MRVVLWLRSGAPNGGDTMDLLITQFFAAFIFVFKSVCSFEWALVMITALACYAVVCLTWSLILDD